MSSPGAAEMKMVITWKIQEASLTQDFHFSPHNQHVPAFSSIPQKIETEIKPFSFISLSKSTSEDL